MIKQLKDIVFVILMVLLMAGCTIRNSELRENSDARIKADSVLKLMTMQEKIGQLNQFTGNWQLTGPLVHDTTKFEKIRNGFVGSMLNIKGVEKTRKLQEMALESRLGIPMIFGLDVIHGFRTIFPIPLAEAASFDLGAIKRSARVAAEEASASGVHWTFAPMVDISRDARWGRVMEGAGEDSWWGAKVARARVEGFQGNSLSQKNTIMACVKHFAAYGDPVAGKDYNTVDMSMVKLFNDYLPPYKAGSDAGAATFMNAFNELNGVPCTGNSFLLRDLLKGQWDFDGFVVSDWGSIGEMVAHGYVENRKQAARAALIAGSDIDMESRCYLQHLESLINSGEVTTELLDDAVRRILIKKFELGLFDDPFKYCDEAHERATLMKTEFRNATRDMARKSIVLLKNENNQLPLSKNIGSIALVGPLMKSQKDMCGFWANEQWTDSAVTVYEGFQKALPNTELTYFEGYDLETNSLSNLQETVKKASTSDAIIVAVGERWDESGEAKSRGNLNLPETQQKLIKHLAATGKKVIVLVMGGRPLIFNEIKEHAPAILFTWWLGTEAGNAIADVVLGDFNPSAKLPMTFPKHIAQVPIYYNYKRTGRPENPNVNYSTRYLDIDFQPAYPFGYGLSYTTFKYSDLSLSKKSIKSDESLHVNISICNTGDRDGEEVIQLYLRDKVGSITRPIKELKAIRKVFLKKGEKQKFAFEITKEELGFWNQKLDFLVEPGAFEVMVGTNSNEFLTDSFIVE